MDELSKTANAVFSLRYHLILVVKYRKDVFTNDAIIEALKEFNKGVAVGYGVDIINQECGTDHIHLLISTKPSTDLCKFINILKGHSSRFIRKEFAEEVREKLWGDSFWSPSYYLATVGNTSVDTLYKYIESQRNKA